MPFLDFSDVIQDPDIADNTLSVLRRPQSLGTNGRVAVKPTRYPNVVGVITSAGPNDLERLDDQQRTGRVLSLVTKFRLRATSPGFQPDYVVWRGDTFIVHTFDPYPQFGAGFYQALIGSIDIQDAPAPGLGQFDYSNPSQSGLTPLG